MKPRYRGENSNIEDIAGRFDKHLAVERWQDKQARRVRLVRRGLACWCMQYQTLDEIQAREDIP
jgi:hypothetical protein